MNDQEKIASPEKREELYNELGFSIQQGTSSLETLLVIKKELKGVKITKEIETLNAFFDFCIFLLYGTIEINSITRAILRAEIPAEKQYHLKFINWIILENYKYLYGYGNSVKKSFWIKKIKPIRKIFNDPQFIADYEKIEKLIIEIRDRNIINKNMRDISIHYDLDPLIIDEMLRALNEYDEIQRVLPFLPFFNELYYFNNKYIRLFCGDNVVDKRCPEEIPLAPERSSINYFNIDLVSKLDEYIIQKKKYFDRSIHQQKGIQQLAMQEKYKDSIEPLLLTSQILKVQAFIDLLKMDLDSAKKAYFMAEYSIEKHLCLKHINVIIYEGFKKLYGLDINDITYWNSYILPIENKIKSDSSKRLSDELDQKLQMLRPTIKGLAEQRHLSVHLEDGIDAIYEMLVNLKPEVEFQNQQDFLKIIMQIFFQSLDILNLIDMQLIEDSKKISLKTNQKVEKNLERLENYPDCPGKDETIKILKQIKSGEFYENIMKKSGERDI
ncbi:MAG: hypothetical protein PHS38_12530 [Bacteroidales bacterium]|nr:hypothetical protein [Bacteroidales bacterium]